MKGEKVTYASKNRAELIRRLDEFASQFAKRMKEEGAQPTRYWSGYLVYAKKKKLLGIFPYTSKKRCWVELAGWPYPGIKRWWVLENGALCAKEKFDYYGTFRGHLGSQWEVRYYLPEDLETDELRVLVSCIA